MVVEGNPLERIQALDDVRLVIAAGRVAVDRGEELVIAEHARALLGAPDDTYEHAPRAQQLADVGLTGAGIAARVRALVAEASPATS